MITAPPVRLVPPTSPAPGPVETALGLVLAQALPGQLVAWRVLSAHLLGVDGGPPVPAPEVAAAAGVGLSWVRGLLPRVRMVARHAGPPSCVVQGAGLLEEGPVRTLEDVRAALVTAGVSASGVHPGGLLRVAEVVGVPCRARVVVVDGAVVVAPAGRAAMVRAVRAAATAVVRGVGIASLELVAAASGAPVEVVAAVLGGERGWAVHREPGGSWWCWRSPAADFRGVVGAAAVRLLSVRAYSPTGLHGAVTEVVGRVSPSVRPGEASVVVPPVGVLVGWLAATGLLLAPPPRRPDRAADADDGGGEGLVLRCAPEAGVRSDHVLVAAVTAAGGTASSAVLAGALRKAGFSASSAVQLARLSPVLTRVARDVYVVR